jgi:hypothetical protein
VRNRPAHNRRSRRINDEQPTKRRCGSRRTWTATSNYVWHMHKSGHDEQQAATSVFDPLRPSQRRPAGCFEGCLFLLALGNSNLCFQSIISTIARAETSFATLIAGDYLFCATLIQNNAQMLRLFIDQATKMTSGSGREHNCVPPESHYCCSIRGGI